MAAVRDVLNDHFAGFEFFRFRRTRRFLNKGKSK
jgi:hypothetical protein